MYPLHHLPLITHARTCCCIRRALTTPVPSQSGQNTWKGDDDNHHCLSHSPDQSIERHHDEIGSPVHTSYGSTWHTHKVTHIYYIYICTCTNAFISSFLCTDRQGIAWLHRYNVEHPRGLSLNVRHAWTDLGVGVEQLVSLTLHGKVYSCWEKVI